MISPVATDAWDGGPKVGAEFMGQARRFHSQLITDSLRSLGQMHLIRTNAEQLSARRGPKPFRPEILIEIERACQSVPRAGCLRRTVLHDKKTLSVENIWLIPTLERSPDWGAGEQEPAISALADTLQIDRRGGVNRILHQLATVSLHSLARWYCRAFATTDVALMANLLSLTLFAESGTGVGDHEFAAETNNGGCWRGFSCASSNPTWGLQENVLQVRTYY
jgi:hypothetical protein